MLGHDVYYIEDTGQYRADLKANQTWLEEIEQNIINLKSRIKRCGDFDKWDIKTRNGLFSTAKGVLKVEEHGAGASKQYVKFRYWANCSLGGLVLIAMLVTLTTLAVLDQSLIAAGILSFLTAALFVKYILDSASVVNCIVTGFKKLSDEQQKESNLNVVHIDERSNEKIEYNEIFKQHANDEHGELKPNDK